MKETVPASFQEDKCVAQTITSHSRLSTGNLRVKKLKFLCKKIFVGMTPYCISVNSAC